eukprot:gene10423-21745_t
MGNIVTPPPSELFAFTVSLQEYQRIKTEGDLEDVALFDRIEKIRKDAILEYDLEIQKCQNVGVIIAKYIKLNSDEKTIFHKHVIDAITKKEKLASKTNKTQDYSLSFSGTAADTKAEKEAGDILRGEITTIDNNNMNIDLDPYLQKPKINNINDHNYLRKNGKWCKFFGAGGCYMYVHVLTKDIVSVRPEEYEDNENSDNISNISEIKDPANGLPCIELAALLEEIERIVTVQKKTPLILDGTKERNVSTFFSYNAQLE